MNEKPDGKSSEPLKSDRLLSPAAKRALVEVEERRKARASNDTASEKETGGRDGPEPIRYGDWEKDGLTSDF